MTPHQRELRRARELRYFDKLMHEEKRRLAYERSPSAQWQHKFFVEYLTENRYAPIETGRLR